MIDLDAPVQYAKGVGPRRAELLAKTGLRTLGDLLLRPPLRYEDRSRIVPIRTLQPGTRALVAGEIVMAGLRRARRMTVYEARVRDDSGGMVKAVWFNQPYLQESLPRGARVVLFGPVERDTFGGGLVLSSPQHEVLDAGESPRHSGGVVPIYERVGPITGRALRLVLAPLAAGISDDLTDPLPPDVRERLGVLPRGTALRRVHLPAADDDVRLLDAWRAPAQVRLILEELFLFQLGLALRKQGLRGVRRGPALVVTDRTRDLVRRVLPFRLTNAQKRALREIAADLQSATPMNRLIQGDVGSGKTAVALSAMLMAVDGGAQAAFMAPTEILAEQHYLTFKRLLAPTHVRVELFSGSARAAARRAARAALAAGETHIAIGTHALVEEGVQFARLGLAVVDEQHRFGVRQRDDLAKKGGDADVLVMTATPIPRTLALTAYGDLDVSVLDERPPGRTPIRTTHRTMAARPLVMDLVRREVAAGRQAYAVYPLVADSENLEDVRGATEMAEVWRAGLPEVTVGLLHGRLKPAEKEQVMAAFASGAVSVLVCTTVVEVGVDVPNASVMAIEHAERFGLAQLHQLRGRVGRGAAASTCVLLTEGKLAEDARARIEALVGTNDGFVLAETDLQIRGPGDVFGTRQWGLPGLRFSDLRRDRELLETARAEAFRHAAEIAAGAPSPLRDYLTSGAWEARFGLSRVG